MTAITPINVRTAVATPALDGKPVRILAEVVHTTDNQQHGGKDVPTGQYRLADYAYGAERHNGSSVYIPNETPSIKLTTKDTAVIDKLIAAEREAATGIDRRDPDYNAARVAVEGVLRLGDTPHGSSLAVTKVEPASINDLMRVNPKVEQPNIAW